MKDKTPLKGIRIVEWASDDCTEAAGLSIAFAGRIAADLGATVMQVDSPMARMRRETPPLVGGVGALSHFLDRNKQRVASPPPRHDGTVTLYIGDADNKVLLAHKGLSSLALVADRAHAPAVPDSEFTLLAVGGLLDLVGDPERQPLRLGGHQLPYSAGLALYAGMAGEICRRRAGAKPDIVRVNIADVAVWLNWKSVVAGSWSTRVPTRLGDGAEWRTIRCIDGWVALVYLEADWPSLKAIVNDARLDEPRYGDRLVRRREAAVINAIVEQAFASFTRAELRTIALDRRIPLGPVWTPTELEHDPQYSARHFLQRVSGEDGGATLQPLLPVMWNGDRFDGARAMEARS